MSNVATALVFAHWAADGKIQKDHILLLRSACLMGFRVILVSTNLDAHSAVELPSDVKVIVRPNHGYDFLSFAIGLEYIEAERVMRSCYEKVILINSSILIFDQKKFVQSIIEYHSTFDFTGISYSLERTPHIQTYYMMFNLRSIDISLISAFLKGASDFTEKDDYINEIEVKLTQFLEASGYRYETIFNPTVYDQILAKMRLVSGAFCPSEKLINASVNENIKLPYNPTHFLWDVLLYKYGFVKTELVRKNPCQINLNSLKLMLESSKWGRGSFQQHFNLQSCVLWD